MAFSTAGGLKACRINSPPAGAARGVSMTCMTFASSQSFTSFQLIEINAPNSYLTAIARHQSFSILCNSHPAPSSKKKKHPQQLHKIQPKSHTHHASPRRRIIRQRPLRGHQRHHPWCRLRRGTAARLSTHPCLHRPLTYVQKDPKVARADKTADLPEGIKEKGLAVEGMNASGGSSQGIKQGPNVGQG